MGGEVRRALGLRGCVFGHVVYLTTSQLVTERIPAVETTYPRFDVWIVTDPVPEGDVYLARRVSAAGARLAVERATLDGHALAIMTRGALRPRFTIEKKNAEWALRDRTRPAFRGAYRTHELAVFAIDDVVRRERGAPPRIRITRAEIREAMSA